MRVGVIGLGSIGSRHARNLEALGHKVYGYDIMITGKVPYMSVEAMKESCDAVVIASPTDTHLDYLTELVEADKPTLVEKPIADRDLLKVQLALSVAKERRVPVYTGFNLRFHGCVRMAREWIDEGVVGKLLWAGFIVAQHNERPEYRRVGVSLNWLSHEVDLALHLLGPANFVWAVGDDRYMVDMSLRHDNGTQVFLHGDYLAKPEIRDFRIVGENGNIRVNLIERWAKIEVGDYRDKYIADDDWDENYFQEMRAFMDTKESSCLATGIDGMNAMKLCLAAKEAVRG